jgi:regulation of enolase protein 1 (concanavalin A-like superfamily)
MGSDFSELHLKHAIPEVSGRFQIVCPPGTDIWDKPPSTHSFNAPFIYQSVTKGSFKSARVTVSASWKDQYDQGGLCLVVKTNDITRWVKTGIEFLHGEANVSVVAKDRWSDWSLRPPLSEAGDSATLEMENASDGSLWVWLVASDGKKFPLREVTWWGDVEKDTTCWVGAYGAKPAPHGETGDLVLLFNGLSVQVQ